MKKIKRNIVRFYKELFNNSKQTNDSTKYIKHFVLCSKKTYESKTLNIMRDCLIMWADQMAKSIDISAKCPIRFYCKEIDNTTWFYVTLTDEQCKIWRINNSNLHISDQSEINPLSIFDLDDYWKLFAENSHPLYK